MVGKLSAKSLGQVIFGAAFGFAAAALIFSQTMTPSAIAQNDSATKKTVVTNKAISVGPIYTSAEKDQVKNVYAFPNRPVVIVQSDNLIAVWENRQGTGLVKLMDIALNDSFKDLIFLDDGRSFVIHTNKAASVYAVDQVVREIPLATTR